MVCQIIFYANMYVIRPILFFLIVYPIDHLKGKTYVVFVGCVPSVYDTWEEARVQVHQFS